LHWGLVCHSSTSSKAQTTDAAITAAITAVAAIPAHAANEDPSSSKPSSAKVGSVEVVEAAAATVEAAAATVETAAATAPHRCALDSSTSDAHRAGPSTSPAAPTAATASLKQFSAPGHLVALISVGPRHGIRITERVVVHYKLYNLL
jgi:hypothetical protein